MTPLWAQWRLKSPASRLFTQPLAQAQIKENIKAPRHWLLWGGFIGDRWIPRTKGQERGKRFHLMTSSWCYMYYCAKLEQLQCYRTSAFWEYTMFIHGIFSYIGALSFQVKRSWLNDLEGIGQGQRPRSATHSFILMIICAKYEQNPSRIVCAAERTRQEVLRFGNFIAKSWPNDLEYIWQDQRSLRATHPLILVIICVKYGKNPSRTVRALERTRQDVPYFNIFTTNSRLPLKI